MHFIFGRCCFCILGSPLITASPEVLTVNYGEQAKFYCSVSSSSIPKVTWSKLYGYLPSERYIKKNYFLISSVKLEDEGTYVCRVETDTGVSEKYVKLYVRGRIYILKFAKVFFQFVQGLE